MNEHGSTQPLIRKCQHSQGTESEHAIIYIDIRLFYTHTSLRM